MKKLITVFSIIIILAALSSVLNLSDARGQEQSQETTEQQVVGDIQEVDEEQTAAGHGIR
ncbi:MAG: hypothetical protein U5L09_01150 [Bacteroidales bacterium]|nr:hypothetical protein [Bacteroidales bacterium]